ncbi:phage terminase small subunit P27 family [Phyllobacterium sp. BT25]|uniref:Phage terminase small subunit P27 family n=1 Tax=Phyllobacterium pellucidum TaxID=2740464 RepID=A0A849VLV5_9HYPH|nr:phage terminase small subunit P27 family [Phyllobacterium pellucidum]NTS29809.1 phage terminase small subunit P27 family [Phyllobacterium pellucidum]
MARPRKPSELKRAEGNRAKIATANIKIDVKGRGRPTAPHSLTSNERELWDTVVASLPNGILCAADSSLLERHACAWQRYREAKAALRNEGMVIVSLQGRVKSPWLSVLRDAEREMEVSGSQIGLSPVARTKLVAADEADDSDIMDFLLNGAAQLDEIWPNEASEHSLPNAIPRLVHPRK